MPTEPLEPFEPSPVTIVGQRGRWRQSLCALVQTLLLGAVLFFTIGIWQEIRTPKVLILDPALSRIYGDECIVGQQITLEQFQKLAKDQVIIPRSALGARQPRPTPKPQY